MKLLRKDTALNFPHHLIRGEARGVYDRGRGSWCLDAHQPVIKAIYYNRSRFRPSIAGKGHHLKPGIPQGRLIGT